jgi:hypothetical protein
MALIKSRFASPTHKQLQSIEIISIFYCKSVLFNEHMKKGARDEEVILHFSCRRICLLPHSSELCTEWYYARCHREKGPVTSYREYGFRGHRGNYSSRGNGNCSSRGNGDCSSRGCGEHGLRACHRENGSSGRYWRGYSRSHGRYGAA